MEQEIKIEMMMKELDEILTRMDSEDVTLEESFQLYKKGVQLCKNCNEKIDKVEKELEIIGGVETL